MKNFTLVLSCLIFAASCKTPESKTENKVEAPKQDTKLYSQIVKDTFHISVCLPTNMDADRTKKYPVIYLLDANLYFDVMASAFKRYSEVGLLPEAILVGIGYKDLLTMDSLRNRDLTFPEAIPEYEMSVSGKADKFLNFIHTELIPEIDKNYPTDKTKRVLMGHSLSGYFTIYALQQSAMLKTNSFSAYIAASPSTHYDNYYILKGLDKMKADPSGIKTYITFGGLEDEEDSTMLKSDAVLISLANSLKEKNKIIYKGDIYSNLDHMDMAFPTFVKGIQFVFSEAE